MSRQIERGLWNIYDDAVRETPNEAETGLAGATLKFIKAFEQERTDEKIDIYYRSNLDQKLDQKVENRRITSRKILGSLCIN